MMASAGNVRRSTRIKPQVKYAEVSDGETPVSSRKITLI